MSGNSRELNVAAVYDLELELNYGFIALLWCRRLFFSKYNGFQQVNVVFLKCFFVR